MENKILLFTVAINMASGDIHNTSNVSEEDLPVLYKALRAIENQIFDNITNPKAEETKELENIVDVEV